MKIIKLMLGLLFVLSRFLFSQYEDPATQGEFILYVTNINADETITIEFNQVLDQGGKWYPEYGRRGTLITNSDYSYIRVDTIGNTEHMVSIYFDTEGDESNTIGISFYKVTITPGNKTFYVNSMLCGTGTS